MIAVECEEGISWCANLRQRAVDGIGDDREANEMDATHAPQVFPEFTGIVDAGDRPRVAASCWNRRVGCGQGLHKRFLQLVIKMCIYTHMNVNDRFEHGCGPGVRWAWRARADRGADERLHPSRSSIQIPAGHWTTMPEPSSGAARLLRRVKAT